MSTGQGLLCVALAVLFAMPSLGAIERALERIAQALEKR